MNKISILLILSLFLFSCEEKDELTLKKEELKELRAEKKTIDGKIATLTEEIRILDPIKEKTAINISVKKTAAQTFERYANIQASVLGDDLVSASSETGGRILSMTAKEGDYVKRGSLIATIDMGTMEKQIAEVETTLSLASTVYERQKRLWDQNIGSEIQYLEAKNNKERIEKSLETLRSQTAKKNVYAPISGYVDMEFLKQGEMAAPGMPIVQILNTNKVKVVADAPENFLGKVKKGDLVEINFPALDQKMNKRITMLGRSIDPSNRTFKIEIDIPNTGNLKPNLLADVRIKDFVEKDVIFIAAELVKQEVNGKKYVYTAQTKDGKTLAKKKYVQTGESDDINIIVTDGLALDDLIIVDGAEKVTENDPIKIIKTETTEDVE